MNSAAKRYIELVNATDSIRYKFPKFISKQEALAVHDLHYHGGKFDPDTMKCGLRKDLEKNDDVDLLNPKVEKIQYDAQKHGTIFPDIASALEDFNKKNAKRLDAVREYYENPSRETARKLGRINCSLRYSKWRLRKACKQNRGTVVFENTTDLGSVATVNFKVPKEISEKEIERKMLAEKKKLEEELEAKRKDIERQKLRELSAERAKVRYEEQKARAKMETAHRRWMDACRVTEEVGGNKALRDAIYGYITDVRDGGSAREAYEKYFGEYGFPYDVLRFANGGISIYSRTDIESLNTCRLALANYEKVTGKTYSDPALE